MGSSCVAPSSATPRPREAVVAEQSGSSCSTALFPIGNPGTSNRLAARRLDQHVPSERKGPAGGKDTYACVPYGKR